jgi:hypothetical protein
MTKTIFSSYHFPKALGDDNMVKKSAEITLFSAVIDTLRPFVEGIVGRMRGGICQWNCVEIFPSYCNLLSDHSGYSFRYRSTNSENHS